MNRVARLASIALVLIGSVVVTSQAAAPGVALVYDQGDPRMAFAAADLTQALEKTGHAVGRAGGDIRIVFEISAAGMGPQAFRIRKEGGRIIRVVGGDSLGAMYGGLELAETIRLGGSLAAVADKARKPYVFRRGLKFNIPFDARGPSYDDTGTSAQKNIAVMWDFAFWRQFLDSMARNRYNVLTLWTTHPYPGLVKLDKYPGVNYDDVCVLKEDVTPKSDRHWAKKSVDVFDPANLTVVKKIALDDKIAFWTRVFNHAEARGIEIHIFHWNIYTFGADGKHGINDQPDNPKTIEYMRHCIAQFLKTYPQVDGIGVTAGEHVNRKGLKGSSIEKWLWQTYGQGVMDAKAADPKREIRFIFRQHQANLGKIVEAFKDFDGPFNTGHKYARARLYSTTTSPYLDMEYRSQLEQYKVPCWLNLRNDDIFVLRWGDADYVREFLQNVPRDLMRYEAGFYMGPDGFVWGREFVSRDKDLSGELEVHKHWYRFMLWGRLGYDLTLTREYFEKRLAQRFAKTDVALLYDTWASSSQIIPQVNRFFFRVNDFQFAPEGSIHSGGFLDIEHFFRYGPLPGSGILSLQNYAAAVLADKPFDGMTPMEVADTLDRLAKATLAGVTTLRKGPAASKELAATLTDMEAMSYLGRYYADKIRGAAAVAVFRADPSKKDYHARAVAHLTAAIDEWQAYAKVASAQYHPQLLSRVHYLDWTKILDDVKAERDKIKGAAPK